MQSISFTAIYYCRCFRQCHVGDGLDLRCPNGFSKRIHRIPSPLPAVRFARLCVAAACAYDCNDLPMPPPCVGLIVCGVGRPSSNLIHLPGQGRCWPVLDLHRAINMRSITVFYHPDLIPLWHSKPFLEERAAIPCPYRLDHAARLSLTPLLPIAIACHSARLSSSRTVASRSAMTGCSEIAA